MLTCSQEEVVDALAEFGRRWADPTNMFRQKAEALATPFPFAMTRISLSAVLQSLTEAALWDLIDNEGVREQRGPARVGHIIAGNTPLLSWTSLLRALLMRCDSIVKLPSGDVAEWGRLLKESLSAVSPDLGDSIELLQWKGGTDDIEKRFYQDIHLLLAYGSGSTISQIRNQAPGHLRIVGYGHRVSFGLVLKTARNKADAALGLARDILMYDQGGCLSPQMIYVEGDRADADKFAAVLATSLAQTAAELPLSQRAAGAQASVREARSLARMDSAAEVWEDLDLRWTVITLNDDGFAFSPGYGVVTVKPLPTLGRLKEVFAPVRHVLQGCAVAGTLTAHLPGVSYVCAPGRLQCPPLSWPEDGIPPLRSLLS